MKFKGKIKNLNHIVISDPTYEKDVWCRYEKDNLKEKDWIVDLDIYSVEDKIDKYYIKGTEFYLLIQKDQDVCDFDENGTFEYLSDIEMKDYTIGMDSACVALGVNNYAKEIINSKDEWQPECAIKTGGDGTFGEVSEGIKDGKLYFLLITGYFEEDCISQNNLFEYLKNKFEITELIKEDETLYGDNRVLNKGDIVEVSTCAVKDDKDKIIDIRNSSYKDELDGMTVTTENPDGTIENTILESHDTLVNYPIEIEVLDNWYDYETGYHYKGKIKNKELIEQLKDFDDNSNPSLAYFSEFDVVKVLEKSSNTEMEMQL